MTKRLKPDRSGQGKVVGEQTRGARGGFSTAKPEKKISQAPVLGSEEARIVQVLARHEAELLRYPNVVGVAQGIRTMGGKPTGEPCVIVYVESKIPRSRLDKGVILPNNIEGILVDVVEMGKVVAQ